MNYGADPKKVIELLEQVGRAHPDVLPQPAPRALFMNYGDSSINFELRVWPRQFNQSTQVKSDLASAVYDAVNAAGMSFPFPSARCAWCVTATTVPPCRVKATRKLCRGAGVNSWNTATAALQKLIS